MSYSAAVITVSDQCSRGETVDAVGPVVVEMLRDAGFDIVYSAVTPKDRDCISTELTKCEYEVDADLIVTVGGTGLGKRDVTPEATRDVIDYELPAITQAMLFYSLQITPRAMLSRAVAGVRNDGLILNLPGSEKAARENLGAVIGTLPHALQMIAEKG